MRRSETLKLSSCAFEFRYSSNSMWSALKPLVLMFAMLLATTSNCRSRVICRESPTRSAFSTVLSPLASARLHRSPKQLDEAQTEPFGSPKPCGSHSSQRKPCQRGKSRYFRDLSVLEGAEGGGRKVLLTMFARQLFPSRRPIERNH